MSKNAFSWAKNTARGLRFLPGFNMYLILCTWFWLNVNKYTCFWHFPLFFYWWWLVCVVCYWICVPCFVVLRIGIAPAIISFVSIASCCSSRLSLKLIEDSIVTTLISCDCCASSFLRFGHGHLCNSPCKSNFTVSTIIPPAKRSTINTTTAV